MRDKNFDVDLLKTLNDQPMPETPLTDDEFTRVLDAACGRLPQKKPAGHRRFPWERVAAAAAACLAVGGDPNRGGFLKLERQNSVSDPGDLAGSLFRADLDPRSFLSYGYEADKDGRIPVAFLVSGSSYYRAPESGAAAKFADSDEPKLLSGWTWPDETERALRNVVAAQVDAEGSGRVVWFASDPTERCMYPGQWQMLLNAMVSGPRP